MTHKFFKALAVLLIACSEVFAQQQPAECADQRYTPHAYNLPYIITDNPPSPATIARDDSPTENDERRGIFWVHGLGGNAGSWSKAMTAVVVGAPQFPARKTTSALISYTKATTGLLDAALYVNQEARSSKPFMQSLGIDVKRNIAIGHGYGGLVARRLDQYYATNSNTEEERMFGGIVTFGTPNGGAYILNSRNRDWIAQLAKEACEIFGTARSLRRLGEKSSPFIFDIAADHMADLTNGACSQRTAIFPNVLFRKLITFSTADSYEVGATDIEALNTFHSNGGGTPHRVAMVGREYADGETPERPKQLMFRTFSSSNISSAPIFGGDDDQALVDSANIRLTRYLDLSNQHLDAANFHALRSRHREARKRHRLYVETRKAYNYLQNADDKWKIIIGHSYIASNESAQCLCKYVSNLWATSITSAVPSITNAADCDDYAANYVPPEPNEDQEFIEFCEWNALNIYISAQPSDGVLTQSSQEAFPGAAIYYMEKTNHLQMLNSSATRDALKALFDGNLGQFFETAKN